VQSIGRKNQSLYIRLLPFDYLGGNFTAKNRKKYKTLKNNQ